MKISPEEFLEQIEGHIFDGDTSLALTELEQFLESDNKYSQLHTWLLQISGQFHRAEREARRGLIEVETFQVQQNRTNEQMIQILRKIEKGDLEVEKEVLEDKESSGPSWVLPLIALIIFGIAAFAGWRYILAPGNQQACPQFSPESEFNLMLFPFREVGGGQDLNPEISIMDRLDQLCRENRIKSSIRIHNGLKQSLDFQTATNQGTKCRASMVIWGTVEQHNDLMDLTTRYKYLGEAEGLEVTKLQLEGEAQVDTTTSISSIVREGVLTKNIEDLILTIFGLLAHQDGEYQMASEALEKASRSDTSGAILTGVLLADSYLAMKKNKEALSAYDRILEIHPDYALALNNRATLQYLSGNFQGAVLDYSRIIQLQPQNTDALAGRIAANLKLQKTNDVQIDLDALNRLNPDRVKIIRRNGLLLSTPKLFDPAGVFLSVQASKAFTHPATNDDKTAEVIISGVIEEGQVRNYHKIKFGADKATYIFADKSKGNIRISLKGNNLGSENPRVLSDEQASVVITKGATEMLVERKSRRGNLYYEIKISPVKTLNFIAPTHIN
ncbi:MAG: tetratricopeptide repeat protein [Bacteroidetes bacterium]|nr:tetratricopeptide repeat protein [Bacteroidota bacterium]